MKKTNTEPTPVQAAERALADAQAATSKLDAQIAQAADAHRVAHEEWARLETMLREETIADPTTFVAELDRARDDEARTQRTVRNLESMRKPYERQIEEMRANLQAARQAGARPVAEDLEGKVREAYAAFCKLQLESLAHRRANNLPYQGAYAGYDQHNRGLSKMREEFGLTDWYASRRM